LDSMYGNELEYYRFNVHEGMEDVRLDECKTRKIDGILVNLTFRKIREATEQYLAEDEVQQNIRKAARILIDSRRRYV
jgi:hypothetical protein